MNDNEISSGQAAPYDCIGSVTATVREADVQMVQDEGASASRGLACVVLVAILAIVAILV